MRAWAGSAKAASALGDLGATNPPNPFTGFVAWKARVTSSRLRFQKHFTRAWPTRVEKAALR